MVPANSIPIRLDKIQIAANPDQLAWQPFRPGVDIYPLYQAPETQHRVALLRYQPGAEIPRHAHPGFEQILVLSGSQADDHGHCRAGTLTINPPGSHHQVASPEGCIVLICWEKPVVMPPDGA
ncbi:MAG TPA: cupin domain-containing protein [Leptolyngbyaceae cyanobacterium M65_K2018_010]|nr:cupin domain-containing protein [Leptolyngbyaceae cyanobacterium M65_K2018_010]